MEGLIIDVLLPLSAALSDKNSETFFTLLSLMKKVEEMTTNLANRSFSHFLFIISNILSNHKNSAHAICNLIYKNLYAYIATNQYLSDKFYRIVINTGISKHFIIVYRKQIAYTRNIKNTAIEIAKVDVIHI